MKTFSTILFIAVKHLRVRLRQSVAAMMSVSLGAMILAVTLAMMEGLLSDFRSKLLEASPAVAVETGPVIGPRSLLAGVAGRMMESLGRRAPLISLRQGGAPRDRDYIARYPELSRAIKAIDGVAEVAPRACSPVIIYHGTRSERSIACGIEPAAEKEVTRLWKWMRDGRMEDLDRESGGIVLGRILAKRLSARVGSMLRLVSPGGGVRDCRVIGVFASNITRIDESQSVLRLAEGQNLAGLGSGSVTGVSVAVKDLARAEPVARAITRRTGYEALTWEEANQSAIANFRMQGVITYFLVIFTAIVGGFGILNIMVTIVMEKVRDIAILRAMGYTGSQVLRVFFLEALILGTGGGLFGCGAGYAVSVLIGKIPFHTGDAATLQSDRLNMLIKPSFFAIAFAISLAISLVAGMSPARRAGRMDPVSIIRGER